MSAQDNLSSAQFPSWRERVEALPHTGDWDDRVTSAMQNAHDSGLREDADDDGEAYWSEVHGQATASRTERRTKNWEHAQNTRPAEDWEY